MSCYEGPEITNDGLVLYYDMNNTQKSWKGAPTTNLLASPSDFTNASWQKTRSSVTSNTTTAPDGTLTADKFIEDTSVTNSHYIYQPVSVTNALVYTKSIYVKAKERSYCAIQFYATNSAFTSGAAYFNLNTGVVTSVDASITNSSISNIGNGWYRISASSTATATASGNIAFHLSSGALATSYTGDGTSGIYIWGAQTEVGSFATPLVTGSRANTQALLDLTNSNTLTATSLTYASDNTFSFNGTSNYVDVASNSALQFLGTLPYTLEAWVYPTSIKLQRIYDGRPTGNGPYPTIGMNATGKFDYTASAAVQITGTTTAVANTWYHVALCRSGTSTKLFVNGVQEGSTYTDTLNYIIVAGRPFIGADSFSAGTNAWSGYISNFRAVKGTAVYTSNFTPPTSPLTAITNTSLLLSCVNAGIYDAAVQSDLVTVSNAQVSTTQAKFGSSSLKFNGTSDYLSTSETLPFVFGSGDWTIETWVYFSDVTSSRNIYESRASTEANRPVIYVWLGTIRYFNGSTDAITSSTVSTGQWYHLAVCKSSGSTRMFLNGTQTGSTYTDSLTYGVGAGRPLIGTYTSSSGFFSGYLDEFRITKGYARYTANFTPPTAPFPTR